MDGLALSIRTAGSGLSAQSHRIQVISENIANANSTAEVPGGDPYQRKIISFAEVMERGSGANTVQVTQVSRDSAPFPLEFDPGNPLADGAGFLKLPNVNALVEMADMREANRSYEANLQVIKQVRDLMSMSLDLLRSTSRFPLYRKSPAPWLRGLAKKQLHKASPVRLLVRSFLMPAMGWLLP